MDLRPPSADDIRAVQELERCCFGVEAWTHAALAQALRLDGSGWACVADGEHGLLGYVLGTPAGEVLDLARVAVAPSARGAGIGRALVLALLSHARTAGYERVMLEVDEANTAAQRTYARAGFREIHRRQDYYGNGRHALVLSHDLDGVGRAPWHSGDHD